MRLHLIDIYLTVKKFTERARSAKYENFMELVWDLYLWTHRDDSPPVLIGCYYFLVSSLNPTASALRP
ncbi:MAG: hypothetical protein ACI93R_003009 [Flavobacteriales bacterium]|jgi:hypothetical protein